MAKTVGGVDDYQIEGGEVMTRVPINGETLRWARELSQVDYDGLAKAAGIKAERIEEFESGVGMPTFRQLSLIASKLDRSLGFFFAPPPATPDVPMAADFRSRGDGDLSVALVREMKRAEQRRDALLDLNGSPENSPRLGAITWENITEQAKRLRRHLGLTEEFTPQESQPNQVFSSWRGALESHGFLIFQTTGIALETFRGLSLYHDTLPVILLNGADSANGKIFTLFHEVAHLANRTSGLCVLSENSDEEVIANRFAANFLMPTEDFLRALEDVDVERTIDHLAGKFKVSRLAVGIRLRTLGRISADELAAVRQMSDENWAKVRNKQKDSSGHPPHWRLRYRDLGPTYVGAVVEALDEGRVDMVDATHLLNAKVPTVERLVDEYYRAGGAA
ncbi:MAG: XRE family transcriptional regulator [Ancrocorticia sp.]